MNRSVIRDERRNGFVMVYKAATQRLREHFGRDDCRVKISTGLAVYVAVAELANDGRHDAEAGVPRSRIAEYAGVTPKSVSETVAELERADLVRVERRTEGGVNLPNIVVLLDVTEEPEVPTPSPQVPTPGTSGDGGSAPQVPPIEEGGEESGDTPEPPLSEQARALFEFWQRECDHPQHKYTPERRAKIEARLKQGYDQRYIAEAIRGAAQAAVVNEHTGKRYDDIELICRNGSKLESFHDRYKPNGATAGNGSTAGGPSSPSARLRDMAAKLRENGE